MTTELNLEKRQVNVKTAKRVRSGMSTAAFWKARLFRNSYRDRDGQTVEIPEFYVRLHHDGITRRVRLTHSDKDKASEEALGLFLKLQEQGWAAITARHARSPASPTVEEFCTAYEHAAASMERSPRPITLATYRRSLLQVCALAGVKKIRELNRDAIERARDVYRAKARKDGRPESAIQNTLAKILRNAAACFSGEARAILERRGFTTENPFFGVKRSQDIQPVTPLSQEVIDRIWQDAVALRDGDPKGFNTSVKSSKRAAKKALSPKKPGRYQFDWRQPHKDAYAALLLALGAGLRANEIDKARWSWLRFDKKGDCFLEVREESDFRTKSGTLRLLKIPREMHDALVALRHDLSSAYIIGGNAGVPNGQYYRSPMTFRVISAWLRERGVVTTGTRGHPLHTLRKQFGSELATHHGLFAAQKLLGHSSPTVTAKYYAAQTELPTLTHVRIVG
jgi:integrase